MDQGPRAECKDVGCASNIIGNHLIEKHNSRPMDHYPIFKEEKTWTSVHGD
jgi:hypothetical protein